jgi:predicted DCC family thiol-disulfide oxidoreductase YuxK
VLIYDGDCGFCMSSLRLALRLGATCSHQAAQTADLSALGLTPEMVHGAAWFVTADRTYRGHEAMAQVLRSSKYGVVRLAGVLVGSRVMRPVASRVYDWVVAHRHQLPGATSVCRLPPQS